ncbi:MAG: alpha/beta hydrolase [Verrucomicrobia bacterium]|nr:alpha/beta hydrolase [Verrucomicrobiota bacterium]
MNRNWRERIKKLVGTFVCLCFLFLVLRWFETSQVYHPHRTLEATGGALGRPWEDVWFYASDGTRLNGWFFPADTNSARGHFVVLLCHGNAGNIGHRLEHDQILLNLGVGVFSFDYRGYGRSAGRPSERGTYIDAMAAYRWLLDKGFKPGHIVALGESLGGAVAAELATQVGLAGIILQSTFTSVPDIGAELFPWLPVRWISTIKYDTRSKLPRIKIPVLIMHSRMDSIVAYHHAEENFAAANAPKVFFELKGDHNDSLLTDGANYGKGIDEFLRLIERNR